MLVHIKSLLAKAKKGGYAIGAFNTSNLEMTLGIVRGAVAMKSPVIIQVSESTIKYAGLETIAGLIKLIADKEGKSIPIALHLDHGKSFRVITECVKAGFSSVHIDASEQSFQTNISLTKQSVEYAHRFGVFVQAELGAMLGKEGLTSADIPNDPNVYMTDPSKVKEFIKKTGVDTLAISVGTLHGRFQGREKIDFPRLHKIHQEIPNIPLVLHGASGLPGVEIKKAVGQGVRIVNIDTDLRIAFTETLKQTLKNASNESYDPRKVLSPSIEAVSLAVKEKIKLLGSNK